MLETNVEEPLHYIVSITFQLEIKTHFPPCAVNAFLYATVRRGDVSLEKLIIDGNTEGKRLQGHSPTEQTDQLKDSLSSKFYTVVTYAVERNWTDHPIQKET